MVEDDVHDRRARTLLAAYRAETGPSAEQEDRLLAAVRHSAATAEEDPDERIPSVRTRSSHRGPALIVGAGLLAAAALAAFAWLGGQARRDPHDPHDAAADHGRSDAGAGRTRSVEASPARPTIPLAEPNVQGVDDLTTHRRRQADRVAGKSSAGTDAAIPDPPAGPPEEPAVAGAAAGALAGELAFVREVNASLVAGDPARALELVDTYPRRHPTRLLQEEVTALQVIASCGLRPDVGRAAAFAQTFPRSMFAERVRRACDAANESPGERTPTPRTYP